MFVHSLGGQSGGQNLQLYRARRRADETNDGTLFVRHKPRVVVQLAYSLPQVLVGEMKDPQAHWLRSLVIMEMTKT
jgi:hypothetical protein